MTTNQTIDGVPRELLERACVNIFRTTGGQKVVDDLRALLDAKSCGKCSKPTACGKMLCEDCCYETPAAQSQGVPVALVTMVARNIHDDFTETKATIKAITPSFLVIGQKLYAEQPAPVAVTLSHVLTAYDYAESHPHKYLRGTSNWCAAMAYKLNACLDEVTQQNTK